MWSSPHSQIGSDKTSMLSREPRSLTVNSSHSLFVISIPLMRLADTFRLPSSFALMTRFQRRWQLDDPWRRRALDFTHNYRWIQLKRREMVWPQKENKIKFIPPLERHEVKCKLSPEWTTPSDIYNFFDFINKIISQQKERRRVERIWPSFLEPFQRKSDNTEKRKLRNKNKWRKEHWISWCKLIHILGCDEDGRR